MKGNTKCFKLAIIYQVADGFGISILEFLDNEKIIYFKTFNA